MDKQENYQRRKHVYTITWLVTFILWVLNGNAHYHHKELIPSQEENYILVAPHRTWWDPVYMAFATKPKQLSLWLRKNSLPIGFLDGGFACVALSQLTGKIQVQQRLNTSEYAQEKQTFLDYVSKWKPSFSGC